MREPGPFSSLYRVTPRLDNMDRESASFTPEVLLAFGTWIEQQRSALEAEMKDMPYSRDKWKADCDDGLGK